MKSISGKSVTLTTDAGRKISLGAFPAGSLQITVTGTGDLVSSDYQTKPDGSLAAVAMGNYTYANPGPGYPANDGINHFPGGGATWDFSASGYGFAGPQTTDTTDPTAIRFGAVVGTFSGLPEGATIANFLGRP